MTKAQVLKKTEIYVKDIMKYTNEDVHGFRHVDRVRKWALRIAKIEGGVDLFLLEMSALLHDVGRVRNKNSHYEAGKTMSEKYLKSLKYFEADEIKIISEAVRDHGVGSSSRLVKILQDADRMDLWGAISIARMFSCWPDTRFYSSAKDFKFRKLSASEINNNCKGKRPEKSVLELMNTSLSIYYTLNTKTAKRLAKDKIKMMKHFVKELKKETIDL